MKDGINGILWMVTVCAAIIGAVFGVLGEVVGLGFASMIAYIAAEAFVISIYAKVAMWVVGFDWTEAPFMKATGAGILMAALSYGVFSIFGWTLFYTLYVIFAVLAALAMVIGLIKSIFG